MAAPLHSLDVEAPVTLRDVATLAGVHVSTASRALDATRSRKLSPATRERVLSAARACGYLTDDETPRRRRRTKSIGIIVAGFDNPYTGPLIRGASRVLEPHGIVALVAESEEEGARHSALLEHFIDRKVDAIATTAAHLGDADALSAAAQRVPVVLALRNVPGSDLPAVFHDDGRGATIATRHLLDLGHRRIAQLPGALDIDSFRRRDDGFHRALAETPDAVDVSVEASASLPVLEEGRRLMDLVLARRPRPTAVFAHNDVMAVGALDRARELGLRCPEDISIVGYNDVALSAHLSPPLTTVSVPSELLGRRLAEMLLARIEDPALPPEEIRLPATLVVRGSTAPPLS